jgi:hypothetical protein
MKRRADNGYSIAEGGLIRCATMFLFFCCCDFAHFLVLILNREKMMARLFAI